VREAATLTASAALKERVADVIAKDIAELLSLIDGRSVTTAAGEVRLSGRLAVSRLHTARDRRHGRFGSSPFLLTNT
jgi:membrane-bound serine protease (ClpP class)